MNVEAIFARNGIPRCILTDNGSNFNSSILVQLCEALSIDKLNTTPYRPQSNGILDRFHGTLVPMLKKAEDKNMDWVKFLPIALYAIRLTPSIATGYSPFALVHGSNMPSPVDLLHAGWLEKQCEKSSVSEWISDLCERIELLREKAVWNLDRNSKKRKKLYDRCSKERKFEITESVLWRAIGMPGKLPDSWLGPCIVEEIVRPVSDRIALDSKRKKIVHLNSLKKIIERDLKFLRLIAVPEGESENDELEDFGRSHIIEEKAVGFNQKDIDKIIAEYSDILTHKIGLTSLQDFSIDTGNSPPIAQNPYRAPVKLIDKIDAEIDQLLEEDIIEPSHSLWASPMIAVPKPNGAVRLCTDLRKVNAVTQTLPFSMPTTDEIVDVIGQSKVISKLDLTKGFLQVRMKVFYKEKTTFICHRGKFQYKTMPFGVNNAPAVFQGIADEALKDCRDCSRTYIDDIVVFSSTWSDHLIHLKKVLNALS